MKPVYEKEFSVTSAMVDRHGRLRPSQLLHILQQVAGDHSALLGTDRDKLMERSLFWAVIRHRVQITRLPEAGEQFTATTWPMPTTRTVRYSDLDINGHMNNCRYLDWVTDLLPGDFHGAHPMAEFTLCYLSEAREQERLDLHWELDSEGNLTVDALREGAESTGHGRVFSARVLFENGVL